MKVVTPDEMRRIETQSYKSGFSDCEFMEKAGFYIAKETEKYVIENDCVRKIFLLVGKGNNGGDALVAGRILCEKGFDVTAILLSSLKDCSPLCQKNFQLFLSQSGKFVQDIPAFGREGVILDGIFGTGFKGKMGFPYDQLIREANRSGLPILAIDIPSGLDGKTGQIDGEVINATETLFLGLPKTGFFIGQGWNVCGRLKDIDFGMPLAQIDEAKSDFCVIQASFAASLLPKIQRNRNKYQTGYVCGLAGSLNMPGAALLSATAALRGGAGMMRLLYPQIMGTALSCAPYEVIRVPYSYDNAQAVIEQLQHGNAVFIGPGLGREKEVGDLLQKVVPVLDVPCVIDADALFFFSEREYKLPSKTIFTPHAGEMKRLLHDTEKLKVDLDYLKKCQNFTDTHKVTLIHKGAPTFIFSPGESIFVNPTGDPGMATAGSGDVLTGLLAALLSQGLNPHHAALLGVFLHGLAGELSSKKRGSSYGMMASDLSSEFGQAFRFLELTSV